MDGGGPSVYTQYGQRLHGSQPGTTGHISNGSAFHFGPFGFFFPLLTVLHLQAQPRHPTTCTLGHAVGVSPAAFEAQSSCNPHRQVREALEGTEVSALGLYFPWAHGISEKHYTLLAKDRDLATPVPALDSFSHASQHLAWQISVQTLAESQLGPSLEVPGYRSNAKKLEEDGSWIYPCWSAPLTYCFLLELVLQPGPQPTLHLRGLTSEPLSVWPDDTTLWWFLSCWLSKSVGVGTWC